MAIQQGLRVLELELDGCDVTIGTRRLLRNDLVRSLKDAGVNQITAPHVYTPGSLQGYVKGHLENGRNYAIVDGGVTLDSQATTKGYRRSLKFNFYQPPGESKIFLDLLEVADADRYGQVRKVSAKTLREIVARNNIVYKPLRANFMVLDEFRKFGSEEAPPPLPPKSYGVSAPAPSLPTEEGEWLPISGKEKKRPLFKTAQRIVPPEIETLPLTGYELKNIERDFVLPDFQRRTTPSHVTEILKAILQNEFYDTAFKVQKVETEDGVKWGGLDLKHRLTAFRIARDQYGVERYNFILLIYSEKHPSRKVYQRVNLGKRPTADDMTKSLDDGSVLFFSELRPYLLHYPTPKSLSFMQMGYAYLYAKKKSNDITSREVQSAILEATGSEVKTMKTFLETIRTSEVPRHGSWRRTNVFRNLLRVYMRGGMSAEQLVRTLKIVSKDNRIFKLSRGRTKKDYAAVYNLVLKDAKKAGR